MGDEEKQASWWTTLPGILTAAAAVITAVTGLVVGLGQLGLFDRGPDEATTTGVVTSSTDPGSAGPGATGPGPTAPGAGGNAASGDTPNSSSAQDAATGWTVTLPEQRAYRSGDVEYELLDATARPDVGDQLAMEISIRCTNHGRYDINFWDATFRLDAGGVSIAPTSGLNEICAGDSSRTGVVRFAFPAEVRDPVLRIKFYEGESRAPLRVEPA